MNNKLKFHSKVSMLGGGSSDGYYRPPETKMMEECNMAVFFMNDGRIHVAKNRFRTELGDISSEQFLKLMLHHLAQKVYQRNALIFQEGLINQLEPMIKKVLKDNKVKVRKDDSI